ncbi:MAG: sugar ABC transporter permease [Acholeplasmatales bacterium]|jgi:multiple sugar transport system permease protein|nr:sugar ABC transporter permease [Acholeplasmatales bacterium]
MNHTVLIQEEKIELKEKKPKTKKKNLNRSENLWGLLLSSTPVIGFIIFGVVPLSLAMVMAFFKIDGLTFKNAIWVGFDNFAVVLKSPEFRKSILNTLIMALSMPISLVISLVIAFFLSKGFKGTKIFRAIYFIPYVCSVVAVSLMWKWIFNTNYGVLNIFLGRTGENAIDWLGDPTLYYISIIIMGVWGGCGFGIILYSAAFTNVNQTLVEAAKVDGASSFQIFKNIVLPSVSPTTFYLFTMGLIGSLQAFAVTNILSGGANGAGPDNNGLTMVYYLYRNIFTYDLQVGIASASSWVISIIILVVVLINFIVSKKWVKYD